MTFKIDRGFKARLRAQEEKVLEEFCKRWLDYARSRCPVDTGFLLSRLEFLIADDAEGLIAQMGAGADVAYALFVEDRTHFIYASFQDAVSELPEIIKKCQQL